MRSGSARGARVIKAEEATATSQDRSEATIEEAAPVKAVEAREAVRNGSQVSEG
jgi:hypothetical protein